METGRAHRGHRGAGRAAAPVRGTDAAGADGVPGVRGADGAVGAHGPSNPDGPNDGREADAAAIEELRARVQELWAGLPESAREDLAACLGPLALAAERGQTDSRVVRESLQTVLLIVGTGALATLSAAGRRRLTALTGIALPERGPR